MIADDLWGDPVRFTVHGDPKAWQRTGGYGRKRFTRKSTARYESDVLRSCQHLRCPDGPIYTVEIRAYFEPASARPRWMPHWLWDLGKRVPIPYVGSRDVDNIAKAVLDGMQPWLPDDRRVVRLVVEKVAEGPARAEVEVRGLRTREDR